MKKLSKDELKQNAKRLMDAHKADKIYATQDGEYFFSHHDSINHNGGLKKQYSNEGWDGEVIPFSKSDFEESVIEQKMPHIISQEDIDNNPVLVEMGVKVGDECEIPTEEESKKYFIKLAKTRLKAAEKSHTAASGEYQKVVRKLAKTPDDVSLQKNGDDAKAGLDAAQIELDNAKTLLDSLTK